MNQEQLIVKKLEKIRNLGIDKKIKQLYLELF